MDGCRSKSLSRDAFCTLCHIRNYLKDYMHVTETSDHVNQRKPHEKHERMELQVVFARDSTNTFLVPNG